MQMKMPRLTEAHRGPENRTKNQYHIFYMQIKKLIVLSTIALLSSACASGAKVGEECTADEDCAEGLECHLHDGEEDHGECEDHGDEEHDEEDHSEEEEAAE